MQTISPKQKEKVDLSDLFDRLLYYRDCPAHGSQLASLGPWLHSQLSDCILPTFSYLPFDPGTYTRTYIGKEFSNGPTPTGSLFEALVMRWDEQSKTSIHGHPKFSFYHVMSGAFEIELFDQLATGDLQTKEVQRLTPAESTWFSGDSHCYDNCIHRVTCLEPGLTFHVYSDDALKGAVFK
ncbi:MAG: hypothetical protein AAGN15_18410 [Cyanobacteria bacterium J06581_3]